MFAFVFDPQGSYFQTVLVRLIKLSQAHTYQNKKQNYSSKEPQQPIRMLVYTYDQDIVVHLLFREEGVLSSSVSLIRCIESVH